MSRRVAFVMGTPRSGSTLLGAMLGSHPDAAMLGELDRLAAVRRERGRAGGTCVLCDGPCPVWDRRVPRSFVPLHYTRVLRRLPTPPGMRGYYGTLFAATGARVLVDTSKNPAWLERRLCHAADWRAARPRFVLITRDGRGTLASWIRRRPGMAVADHVALWARGVRALMAAYEAFDPAGRVHLRYEALVADPGGTLAPVCAALGLDPDPAMVEYWRHDHHPVAGNVGTLSLVAGWRRANGLPVRAVAEVARDQSIYDRHGPAIFDDQRWRTELDAAALAAFEAGAGDLNRSLGYG